MNAFLQQLFLKTLTAPAEAARIIQSLSLSHETGWTALALSSVLNTLAYFLTQAVFPLPPEYVVPILATPVMFLITLFSVTTVAIFVLFWCGRILGGTARFADVLALVTWLQFLRVAVQLGTLVFMIILPGFAVLFAFAAGLFGIWILLHFMRVAHGFATMGQAVLTLFLTFLGLVMGLSVFLSAIGLTAMGIN